MTNIAQSIETLWTSQGQPYAQIKRLSVEGWLSADGQAALTTAQLALESALRTNRVDLILYTDAGAQSSCKLLNQGSISGVKIVKGPVFDSTRGSEFATERHFTFEAEAEYALTGSSNVILEFEEEISIEEGGPIYIHQPAMKGPAFKTNTIEQMPWRATQSGSAVGYRKYPSAPLPLWPSDLMRPPRGTRRSPTRKHVAKYQGFPVTWQYEFESIRPLIGLPSLLIK